LECWLVVEKPWKHGRLREEKTPLK
jgi:hypothetical protein